MIINIVKKIFPIIIFITYAPVLLAKEAIKVTFLSPNPPNTGYWQHYDEAMQSAAKNLNIDLTIIHAEDLDRFAYLKTLKRVDIKNTDYVIALLKVNTETKILKTFENTGVKVFTANMDVPQKHANEIGSPRKIYKNWIGHVIPDDYHAGNLLAKKLIAAGQQNNINSGNIIAISGARDASVSYLRNQGLLDAVSEIDGYRVDQILYTDWKYKTVRERFKLMLGRYPDSRLIWCASDEIALAVLDELKENNINSNYQVGSIDWSENGLKLFPEENYVTSIGGHVLEGGIILALIRDYHDGNDFAETIGTQLFMKMGELSTNNMTKIQDLIQGNNWQNLHFDKLSVSLGGDNQVIKTDYQQVLNAIYHQTTAQ